MKRPASHFLVAVRFLLSSACLLLTAAVFAAPRSVSTNVAVSVSSAQVPAVVTVPSKLLGYSGALKVVVAHAGLAVGELFGLSGELGSRLELKRADAVRSDASASFEGPGIWTVAHSGSPLPVKVISTVPFSAKQNGYLNGYHIGTWPAEVTPRAGPYA